MIVNPDLNKIMRAGKFGCSIEKQNEAGIIVSVAILLACTVLICAYTWTSGAERCQRAVNADMDRIEQNKGLRG